MIFFVATRLRETHSGVQNSTILGFVSRGEKVKNLFWKANFHLTLNLKSHILVRLFRITSVLFINIVQLLVNTYGKDFSNCIIIREYQSGSIPEGQGI